MRFHLTLHTEKALQALPANYQYPLSAAIYRIIERADKVYAAFLHDQGYQIKAKVFKLFTFSDLTTPFKIQGDRLVMQGNKATLTVCFHLPDAAGNFIKGLFMSQEVVIADRKSRVAFTVQQVEALPAFMPGLPDNAIMRVRLQPMSPVVCGVKNARGHYDYLAPDHAEYSHWLLHNWKEKYAALYGEAEAAETFAFTTLSLLPGKEQAKARLITIKAGTPEETRIKGFVKFGMEAVSLKKGVEVLMNCGMGLYNSQGMGCVSFKVPGPKEGPG